MLRLSPGCGAIMSRGRQPTVSGVKKLTKPKSGGVRHRLHAFVPTGLNRQLRMVGETWPAPYLHVLLLKTRTNELYRSDENIVDHVAMDVGQASQNAIVVKRQTLVVQTQQVQNCGVEIVNCDDVLHRLVSELISCAI